MDNPNDPFTTGLMALFAANNPAQAAPLLTQMGVPVPGGGDPSAAGMGGLMGQGGPMLGNAGLQGIKAPAPVTPIMQGGVSGGVRAPEVQKMQMGSPAIASLMQALLGGGRPMPVPTLGEYIRGGKY